MIDPKPEFRKVDFAPPAAGIPKFSWVLNTLAAFPACHHAPIHLSNKEHLMIQQ